MFVWHMREIPHGFPRYVQKCGQLKSKLTSPESVCVNKTSGMQIAHLTTRRPGYVNEDTEAVIIHLGTNDIGDQANKEMQDINELTK